MTKMKFLLSLHNRLLDLPQAEVEERLRFYSEMIEDRMEDGLSEEEAVAAIGTVDEIAAQIIADISPATLTKEITAPKKKWRAWEIVLLALGSPIWLSLLIAAFAVVLSCYAVLWSVVISLWAVFVSLIGCALACVVFGICFAPSGYGLAGIAMIGAGLVCAGLAIFLFFGCKAATKGTLFLTRKVASGIQNCFVKRRLRNE